MPTRPSRASTARSTANTDVPFVPWRILQTAMEKGCEKMEDAYHKDPAARRKVFETAMTVVQRWCVVDEHYLAWQRSFSNLLLRLRFSQATASNPAPALSEETKHWMENRLVEVSIWFAAMGDEEQKREVVMGMEETELWFAEREKKHGKVKITESEIMRVGKEFGAFEPLHARFFPTTHAHVQHSLSHMSERKRRMYFGGGL